MTTLGWIARTQTRITCRHWLPLRWQSHKAIDITSLKADEDITAARNWIDNFTPSSIPKDRLELSFSRSSGPGGQNVNKVNTKATLRVPLDQFDFVPEFIRKALAENSTYVSRQSNSIQISSTRSRSQADNVQDCINKLHALIVDTGEKLVPGITSTETRDRVARLQQAEGRRRKQTKVKHSDKKSGRRKVRADD